MTEVILVHGMRATEKSWFNIPDLLKDQAYAVTNEPLPGHSGRSGSREVTFDHYVSAVADALPASGGAVLVGHSMGGMVISQVASDHPDKVAGLIYVTALLPKNGQSIAELMFSTGTDLDTVKQVFEDLGIEDGHPALTDQPLAPLAGRFEKKDGFADIPRTYVRCTKDRILPLSLQNMMIGEWPGTAVADIASDHVPQLTHEDDLLGDLLAALSAYGTPRSRKQ